MKPFPSDSDHHSFIERAFLSTTICVLFFCVVSSAQDCTLPSRILLPTPDLARYDGFGQSLDVYQDYMVAGAPYNDSLQADAGIAYVYKLNLQNQWVKIAELVPSDPAKSNSFGRHVSIFGNSIAVFASEYNDAGEAMAKIYIFEKPSSGEWTSGRENYIIKNAPDFLKSTFGQFSLHNDELITMAWVNAQNLIQVYAKSGGVFSLSQSFESPKDAAGYSNYAWTLAVSDNFFAIGSEQFANSDGSNGVVFIYEKIAGSYVETPSVLRSTEQTSSNWQGFGIGLTVHNSTVFVAGLKRLSNNSYNQSFYIFEQPATGWTDAQQPAMLESPGYLYSQFSFAAHDDYFFITSPDYESVTGFRKPEGGWSPFATYFQLDDLPEGKHAVGFQIRVTDTHLVIGCPAKYLFSGIGDDAIADYYSPTGEWDCGDLSSNQLIHEVSINATDDFFGTDIAAYGDYLAVTASRDDEWGLNSGAVYLYNLQKGNALPDQKVFLPEPENSSGFGKSLAMGDSLMFVGAPFKDSVRTDQSRVFWSIGKVYVYRLTEDGWKYHSQILAPQIKSNTNFGQTVVWSSGYVAVTEFYAGSSESVGLVHIYKENPEGKFMYTATLKPSVQLRSDFFGKSMVMNDSMIVIGTGNFAVNSSYRMRVFIFKKKGEWADATEDASLINSDNGWSDRFGASVAMHGDYIVVGAPSSPGYDPRPIPRDYIIPGAAYLYKRPEGGWKGTLYETAKLAPSDPSELGNFGYSVAIDHDDIFVGAPDNFARYNYADQLTNNDNTLKPGKVYHYMKPPGGWETTQQEHRQLMSFEPEPFDGYGHDILISDRYLYVSALLDDTPSGFRSGSVQTMMQLPVIDPIRVSCSDEAEVKLHAFPARGGEWTGPGVNNATSTFNPAVAGPGIHTLNYTVSGCQETAQAEVVESDFEILDRSEPAQTKCIGDTVSLIFNSNEEDIHYAWYFRESAGDEFEKIDSAKKEISVLMPGYYQVNVQRPICPLRTENFVIEDEAEVDVTIDPVSILCADDQVALHAEPSSGVWSGTGISVDGVFDTSDLPDGSYKGRYKIVTGLGCTWRDSITISIDRLREPVLDQDRESICGATPVVMALSNVDSRSAIAWYNAGNPISGKEGASLTITQPGTYAARISKHGCAFDTRTIHVMEQVDTLFVPNIVTPNNDTQNDYFEIRGEGLHQFNLSVLNRYGKIVYEATDATFQWPAENISSGVYYWRITYQNCLQRTREKKGWVHIIR